jgi:predicted dinucleotide-utilizing enzyme
MVSKFVSANRVALLIASGSINAIDALNSVRVCIIVGRVSSDKGTRITETKVLSGVYTVANLFLGRYPNSTLQSTETPSIHQFS